MSAFSFLPSAFHSSSFAPSPRTCSCRTSTTPARRRRPRACVSSPGTNHDNNDLMLEILSSDDQLTVMPLIASLTPSDAALFRRSKALDSPNRAIRVSAHGVLGRIGSASEDTARLLACLCGLDDHSVRAAAAGSLGDLHASATDTSPEVLSVLERYSSPDSEAQYIVRYSCISALGIIGSVQSISFLTTVNTTPLEISGAVTALGDIPHSQKHEEAVVYVRNNKAHGDDLVRGAIARTFGIWDFRDDLEEMLQNEESWYNSPHVRNMLAQALLTE